MLRRAGVGSVKTPFHAPNANAFAERWIRSAREECLNHLILFGIKSLRRVVRTYARFFNGERPRQGIDSRAPSAVRTGQPPPESADGPVGKVHCEEYLGGLLRSYHRVAA